MNSSLTTLQIGMTASQLRAGGVDRYYFTLMHSLHESGMHVRGLVTGSAADALVYPNVAAFAPERDALPLKWLKLRNAAGPLLPSSDVAVAHFAPYALPIIDRLKGTPLIVHFHGPWALEGQAEGNSRLTTSLKYRIERTVYAAAARFIVLSAAFADILEHEYHVNRNLIRVIPGGVDTHRFGTALSRSEARAALGWPIDRPTVVTVRRLVHAKGVDSLIRAASIIRKQVPDIAVAIGGTGPLAEPLRRLIAELDLEGTVRLIGHVPEDALSHVYRAADLFVVPTLRLEGFGLVVLEALASGTPAFVTPVGGLSDVVRPLDASLVLEGTGPDSIARGIVAALRGGLTLPDDEACAAYARKFAWDGIARRVAAEYREATTVR